MWRNNPTSALGGGHMENPGEKEGVMSKTWLAAAITVLMLCKQGAAAELTEKMVRELLEPAVAKQTLVAHVETVDNAYWSDGLVWVLTEKMSCWPIEYTDIPMGWGVTFERNRFLGNLPPYFTPHHNTEFRCKYTPCVQVTRTGILDECKDWMEGVQLMQSTDDKLYPTSVDLITHRAVVDEVVEPILTRDGHAEVDYLISWRETDGYHLFLNEGPPELLNQKLDPAHKKRSTQRGTFAEYDQGWRLLSSR